MHEVIKSIYEETNENCCEESCMICGDILHNGTDRTHKLKCNHEYHLECIYKSYKNSFSIKKRECPYCRKDGGYLPLKSDDMKPIKNINVEYKKNVKKILNISSLLKVTYTKEICKGITKCGNNCKNKAYPNNDGFCRIHKKIVSNN